MKVHGLLVLAVLGLAAQAAAQTETIEYYGTDAIGSVRVVFDPSGAILARQDYTPFGEPLLSAPAQPPERFGGQSTDDEVQQAYFHARQFQARLGRFATIDAVFDGVFDPQRWNRYAYAGDSPATLIDPYGLQFKSGVNGCDTPPHDHKGREAWWDTCVLVLVGMEPLPPDLDGGSVGGGPGRPLPAPPTDPNPRPTDPSPPGPPPGPNPPGPPPGPNPPSPPTKQCYMRWRFSSLFGDGKAGTLARALEIGAPVSVIGDLEAATIKLGRPGAFGTSELWASGINRALRSVMPTAWRGTAITVGDALTAPLAIIGVGTASYNMTVWAECATGVLQ